MRRGNDLTGMPIIARDHGERIAKVKDVIYGPGRKKVVGLLVHTARWRGETQLLRMRDVEAIGPDAITIRSRDLIVDIEQAPEIKQLVEETPQPHGLKMMTTDGRELGCVSDLVFDENTGDVQGCEISGGLIHDLYVGKACVPAADLLEFGKDVAFAKPEAAAEIDAHIGGLKAAIERTDKSLHETAGAVGKKVRSLSDSTGQRLREATSNLGDRLHHSAAVLFARRVVPMTQGRTTLREVRSKNDMLIVAAGQTVTETVIQQARKAHKEPELVEAVGLSTREIASRGTQDLMGTAGQRLRQGAARARDRASRVWRRLKSLKDRGWPRGGTPLPPKPIETSQQASAQTEGPDQSPK